MTGKNKCKILKEIRAQIADEVADVVAIRLAAHAVQNPVGNVLQRNIHILHHLFALGIGVSLLGARRLRERLSALDLTR